MAHREEIDRDHLTDFTRDQNCTEGDEILATVLLRSVLELEGNFRGNAGGAKVELDKTLPETLDSNIVALLALVAKNEAY
jgi:hypothetical protein